MTKKYQLSAVNGIIDAGVNWKNITADLKANTVVFVFLIS